MKTVLVTGGTKGIGFEIIKKLSNKEYKLVFFSRNPKNVEKVKKFLNKKQVKYFGDVLDATDNLKVETFISSVRSKFGKIDILINNVGGGGDIGTKEIYNNDLEFWNSIIKLNLETSIHLINLCLPDMIKNKWGRVICISSVSAKIPKGKPWYIIAKKSVTTLMKSLSVDRKLIRSGITFNSISPGALMIPGTGWHSFKKENEKRFTKYIEKKFPLGRLGNPEEIASIFPFLCSNSSSFLNGADIVIDGGQSNEKYED
tara:strand:+ start:532 stop:1305 length:774 start_codon:yes stop_codon:yes gene_type:complete